MSTLTTKITRAALALCFATPLVSWADAITAVNPVTGETETYTYKFTGTDIWNGTEYWQDSNGDNPSAVPAKSGDNIWAPILFAGDTININASMSVEGWNLRMGLYNGASVTLKNLQKLQGGLGMWITVDSSSHCTIEAMANKKLANANPLCLYSANEGGIAWTQELSSSGNESGDTAMPFHYYLAGNGTVAYNGGIAAAAGGAHVIKQADVTLSGNSEVVSKTLVSFTSSSTTFTADAAIKVKNGDNVLKTVYLTSVTTADDTTLTAEDDVGACELVQTPTGIVLYYVDGDPADVNVEEKTYKPSININFTNGASNGLTTQSDVGLSGYEVPGTSWNNYVVANSTFSTVNAVDSTGAASAMSGVSVTISGTRGSYSCGNLTPSSNPLHGYIDENGNNPTPTVTVTGIPYYKYRVLVYHSTDSGSVPFGYDTINGKNYTYENDALSEGTTAWGNAGAQDSANAIAEGGNVLVTEALSGSTLTVVGHRAGGASNARGCIAAIQIIEVKADVGENDLEIPVSGDTQYTVEETKELSGTVYLTGLGTLTLAGENKISAATIEIGGGVTLVVNADRLDATTFTGAGTVVYDGLQPETTKGFDNSAWTGTVWVKNVGDTLKGEATDAKVTTRLGSDTTDATSNELNKWGNANSFVKFTNVRAFMAKADVPWTLVLEDDDTNYAWYNNEGWTARSITIAALKGDGTFWDINDGGCRPYLNFGDASQFTGTIKALGKQVFLNDTTNIGDASSGLAGRITVPANQTLTVASGKTWHTSNGLVVNGTLNVNGTLASDSTTAAVSGSGTVVFTGSAPSPTGDAWWKNASWTGTVQMKDVTNLVGGTNWTGTNFLPNDYGNTGSVLELYNCSGWLPNNNNYQCTVPLKVTGTLTINDGISGNKFVISHLSGSGAIHTTSNGATTTLQILEADGFTGYVQLNSKRVVFGNMLPSEYTVGNIYVGEGFSFTVPNSNVAWYGTGGITLAGELKAAALSNFGGGTTITTTDDGVFTLVSNSDTDDLNVDYTRIQGTGTLKFEGSKYRTISTNNFPTAMIVENNISNGLIHRLPGEEVAIGSLSGTGQMRSDWGGSGSTGDRDLRILQAKDTTYSGLFASNNDRIDEVYVAPGASTAGTLTLSGTQTASNGLIVETGASVNLTGTWVGATTVAGTFGGTGTLTGNLTFSDGATFKANASALTVSGTVTIPAGEGESLTIDAANLDADEVTILSSESITTETDVSKVTVDGLYTVEAVAGALKLVSTRVEVTVPAINNATVTVSVGGETIGTEAGTYKVAPDAVVIATYAAEAGYEISGQTVYTIDVSNSETTFNPAGTTEVKQYVAQIYGGEKYTTLQAAVDAAVRNSKIIVLANETDGATIPSKDISFYIYTGAFTTGEILDATGDFITTRTTENISISDDIHADKVTATKYSVAAAFMAVTIDGTRTLYGQANANDALTAANAGPIGTTVEFLSGDPASYAEYLPMFDYDSKTGVYTKVANPVAAVYSGVQQLSVHRTLAEAVAAAENGQTVKLLDGIELESAAEIASGKSITIDLNGKTVAGPAGGYAFSNAGGVTIVGNGTVTGAGGIVSNTASGATVAISNGTYTVTGDLFGNVEGGTIAVSGGTYNQSVADEYLAEGYEVTDNDDGTYGVREDKGWIYAAPGYWNYTGAWTGVTPDDDDQKVTIESGAAYTASNASDGRLVTVEMTASFADVNEDEPDATLANAKGAVRLGKGETDGTYTFQLLTSENSTPAWKDAAGFAPAKETDYTFVFVFDLTNKTYTAGVVVGSTTNELSVGGGTAIPFAAQNDNPVQTINFVGEGTVSSIKGGYETPEPPPAGFVEDEEVTLDDGTATLTEDQAKWLNACGDKAAVAAKIATMDSTAFNNAYLLNLNITGEFSYEFKVTAIEVGDDDVTLTVSLTRTGALDETTKINGTVALTGTDELGKTFETIDEATVVDEDFSEDATTTITLDKGDAKFFLPVIR